jgi:hypothetical protein
MQEYLRIRIIFFLSRLYVVQNPVHVRGHPRVDTWQGLVSAVSRPKRDNPLLHISNIPEQPPGNLQGSSAVPPARISVAPTPRAQLVVSQSGDVPVQLATFLQGDNGERHFQQLRARPPSFGDAPSGDVRVSVGEVVVACFGQWETDRFAVF